MERGWELRILNAALKRDKTGYFGCMYTWPSNLSSRLKAWNHEHYPCTTNKRVLPLLQYSPVSFHCCHNLQCDQTHELAYVLLTNARSRNALQRRPRGHTPTYGLVGLRGSGSGVVDPDASRSTPRRSARRCGGKVSGNGRFRPCLSRALGCALLCLPSTCLPTRRGAGALCWHDLRWESSVLGGCC